MALTFTLGQPCPGGNHWDVTIAGFGGQPITMAITYPSLREPMSEEEIEEFAVLFFRYLVSTHPSASMATIRGKLANAVITVSL